MLFPLTEPIPFRVRVHLRRVQKDGHPGGVRTAHQNSLRDSCCCSTVVQPAHHSQRATFADLVLVVIIAHRRGATGTAPCSPGGRDDQPDDDANHDQRDADQRQRRRRRTENGYELWRRRGRLLIRNRRLNGCALVETYPVSPEFKLIPFCFI